MNMVSKCLEPIGNNFKLTFLGFLDVNTKMDIAFDDFVCCRSGDCLKTRNLIRLL